eukprot:Rhum_TRINITY_DN7547_c0_g2::Rhum_TRINITY_DN7547_c0_g2_i1::g.23384::m.23384
MPPATRAAYATSGVLCDDEVRGRGIVEAEEVVGAVSLRSRAEAVKAAVRRVLRCTTAASPRCPPPPPPHGGAHDDCGDDDDDDGSSGSPLPSPPMSPQAEEAEAEAEGARAARQTALRLVFYLEEQEQRERRRLAEAEAVLRLPGGQRHPPAAPAAARAPADAEADVDPCEAAAAHGLAVQATMLRHAEAVARELLLAEHASLLLGLPRRAAAASGGGGGGGVRRSSPVELRGAVAAGNAAFARRRSLTGGREDVTGFAWRLRASEVIARSADVSSSLGRCYAPETVEAATEWAPELVRRADERVRGLRRAELAHTEEHCRAFGEAACLLLLTQIGRFWTAHLDEASRRVRRRRTSSTLGAPVPAEQRLMLLEKTAADGFALVRADAGDAAAQLSSLLGTPPGSPPFLSDVAARSLPYRALRRTRLLHEEAAARLYLEGAWAAIASGMGRLHAGVEAAERARRAEADKRRDAEAAARVDLAEEAAAAVAETCEEAEAEGERLLLECACEAEVVAAETAERDRLVRRSDVLRRTQHVEVDLPLLTLVHDEAIQRLFLEAAADVFAENRAAAELVGRFDRVKGAGVLLSTTRFLSWCSLTNAADAFAVMDAEVAARSLLCAQEERVFAALIVQPSELQRGRHVLSAHRRESAQKAAAAHLARVLPLAALEYDEAKQRAFVEAVHAHTVLACSWNPRSSAAVRERCFAGEERFDAALRACEAEAAARDALRRAERSDRAALAARLVGARLLGDLQAAERRGRKRLVAQQAYRRKQVSGSFDSVGLALDALYLPADLREPSSRHAACSSDGHIKAALESSRARVVEAKAQRQLEERAVSDARKAAAVAAALAPAAASAPEEESAWLAAGYCRLWRDLKDAVRCEKVAARVAELSVPFCAGEAAARGGVEAREESEWRLIGKIRREDRLLRLNCEHNVCQYSSGLALVGDLQMGVATRYFSVDVGRIRKAHGKPAVPAAAAADANITRQPRKKKKKKGIVLFEDRDGLLLWQMLQSEESVRRACLVGEEVRGLEEVRRLFDAQLTDVRRALNSQSAALVRRRLKAFEQEVVRRRAYETAASPPAGVPDFLRGRYRVGMPSNPAVAGGAVHADVD